MAGDWIKMRGSLCTHPKVLLIAKMIGKSTELGRRLGKIGDGCLDEIVTRDVTRDVTLASLLRIWSAVNEHTDDGVMKNCTLETIDDITGMPSFGAAMASVGWAMYDEKTCTVTFPNFLENNAPSKGNARSSPAERQAKYREKLRLEALKNSVTRDVTPDVTRDVTRDVTLMSQSDAREEKRREDIKEPPLSPDGGKPGKQKTPAISLKTFLADCETKGERPLRGYAPLWTYAQGAGLDADLVGLAWAEFMRQMLPGGVSETKRQTDWRKTFRNYVEKNYLKLWAIDPQGQYFLTSQGKQAAKLHESKAAA